VADLASRFPENPILTPADIQPSHPDMKVECVLNPGAFTFDNKTWLLLRVAERPEQKPGKISFPILNASDAFEILEFDADDPALDISDPRMVVYNKVSYLSTISHLRLVCSDDMIHFSEPKEMMTKILGKGPLESFGIEDCRVTKINNTYYLTYTEVSRHGVGVGLMHTNNWNTILREGMILPPHNKDCTLFPEKINGRYYCLHRPSGVDIGGNFVWISSSMDLKHWGDHRCILTTRPDSWDSARVGAGASPIKTPEGWLEIYHGANANHRYCLGAMLMDLKDPHTVIARSVEPIMEPIETYEQEGFFGHVVFTNGHIVDGDKITVYYGASDTVICGATFSVSEILATLKDQLLSPQS
jgi:predicted GH43/DUF377 family glycosyl hydrolase